MWAPTIVIAAAFLLSQACAMEVVNLTDADFDKYVDGKTNVLVEFFAPWCGHCKTLAPEWKSAASLFEPSDGIILAAVDATVSPDLAKRFGVSGYPTIMYYKKSVKPIAYNGGRTQETITEWINKEIGTNKKMKSIPSFVTTLTTDNFDAHVLGKKAALVEFYAPWCGHCKELTPKYEKLASIFAGDKNVLIGKVDATEHGELAQRFDVSGYPTIKFFPAGSADPESYEENREVEDFVTYINLKAGTQRGMDGGLLPTAGTITILDDFISKAVEINETFILELTELIGTLDAVNSIAASLYLSTASKIIQKGRQYVETEITRLSSMIANPSVVPVSKTGFQLRQNVLRAFLKK